MAKTESETVLVTGITGNQGGALAGELLDAGIKVRGVTRDPQKDKAQDFRRRGAEIVAGDFDRPETIKQAARGTDVAYIISTPYEQGVDAETREGLAVVDAVSDAGVSHIVYSSVANADQETGIPHFDSKVPVERKVQDGDIPWTIVAPVWFRENLISPWWLPALKEGKLPLAMSGDTPLQDVSVAEIGRFDAHVVQNHHMFEGERIDVASDAVTPEQMARTISDVARVAIRSEQVPIKDLREQNEDFARMFEWFESTGYSVDIARLKAEHPEVGWESFTAWARRQDWTPVQQAVQQQV